MLNAFSISTENILWLLTWNVFMFCLGFVLLLLNCWFVYDLFLHLLSKVKVVMVLIFLICSWIQLISILLRAFVLTLTSKTAIQCSLLVASFPVLLQCLDDSDFTQELCYCLFHRHVKTAGVSWCRTPQWIHVFLCFSLLRVSFIIASILLHVIDLITSCMHMSSWFNFSKSYVSRFSSVLDYRFSKRSLIDLCIQ